MCRHLAYLGPPVTLASLLYDPPHSLLRQSWAPRMQRHGTVNADGYGVGWYQPDVRPEPARVRRAGPMWADRSLASLAGVVRSAAVMAAVRSATPPAPIEETGAAPFTEGRWLFSFNGRVTGDLVALRGRISSRRQARLEGASDAELLFALLMDRIDGAGAGGAVSGNGAPPGARQPRAAGADRRAENHVAAALTAVVATVPGRLNLLLTDGHTVWATAHGDSLWWRSLPEPARVVVASEPFDDEPGWVEVPDGSRLTATVSEVTCTALAPSGADRERTKTT
jgi:glutamine amidotransferase